MKREEIREQIVGPIATVPTPFDDRFRLDLGRMTEAVERWVEGGLLRGMSVIKVAAAMGEGPQLTEAEWAAVLKTAVDAAKGRVPIMGAVHYKDTVRTVDDARRASEAGVIGLQVSPPIFNQPSETDVLRYFGGVSDGIDIGVMIYNTPWLPHGAIYPATFGKMRDMEYIVAIKWSPPDGVGYDEVFEFADHFSIIDNSSSPVECYKLGGRGYLGDGISAYPSYYLGVWDLITSGKYDQAQAEWDRVTVPLREIYARVVERSGSDAKMEKALCELMGLPMGPPRPPSIALDAAEMAELRNLMAGWGWPVTAPSGSAAAG